MVVVEPLGGEQAKPIHAEKLVQDWQENMQVVAGQLGIDFFCIRNAWEANGIIYPIPPNVRQNVVDAVIFLSGSAEKDYSMGMEWAIYPSPSVPFTKNLPFS